MATTYKEALEAAAHRFVSNVDRPQFSEQHIKAFDELLPERFRERIIPELLREPYSSSISETYDRLKQYKWEYTLQQGGLFTRDKESARQEMMRLFDNFTGDAIKAMEQFRSKDSEVQRLLKSGSKPPGGRPLKAGDDLPA
jgi:hypothetical protein